MLIFLGILLFVSFVFLVTYALSLHLTIPRMRAFRLQIGAGSPDEIPEIDVARLHETTKELEALGFERVDDLVIRNFHDESHIAAPIADPSVAPALQPLRLQPHLLNRVLLHRHHGCLGIVTAMAMIDTKGKRSPKKTSLVTINSYGASGVEKWSYGTTDLTLPIAQDKITRVCCQPRVMWTRMPKATAGQLLDKHLARREQIAAVAQVEWALNPTIEDYINGEQEWLENARAVYGQMTLVKLWNELRRIDRERKNPEWLGELKGRLE